ncbi:uncharacterized protein ACA1_153240 [Acanthamoeba castellanii str. Neff]|uniref:Uncharacterized protein n=1 Tax=Acanthamoeba castellanii (strain ATCC 30010 / Neff) TaxID=1257118 RepID=L8HG67_ACACF|nr:uncharacterized protein ACA1_153240 [Acanthamoeba castellanii str. Neff]ELR24115.1 hypothetical protein ACA1_153240 [Acanthamoeba castellanii str. Neff]
MLCGTHLNDLLHVGPQGGTAGAFVSLGISNALLPLSDVDRGAYYALAAVALFLSTMILSYLEKPPIWHKFALLVNTVMILLYLSRPDVTWYYPLIGLLSVVLGIGCALAASLLPLPSIATLQFARAIQTNMLIAAHLTLIDRQVLSKLIELMVGVYTTSPRKDQKRTRLRIRAELFLKALRRNIAATAQLADAAKWEHFFATEDAAKQYLAALQSLAEAATAMHLGLDNIKYNNKLYGPHLTYSGEPLRRSTVAMQTYLLGTAPGLQWKASKLSPLYNFFTRPFVMAVPLEQVTVEASGHLRSLRSKLHQEEEQVEQARRKVAEVSRCIDQTHRQFRHDVIWSAGTKAENRGWSLDDVIPIHCFMFGLQTFLRQSSQLHTVQFRWYSRDPREYLRQFIYAEFIAPIVSGAKTLLRLVKMPWRVFTFIRDTAPSRRKRFAEWNQWLFSLALIVTVAGLLVFIPSLQSIFPFGLWAPLAVVLSVERGARQGSTLKATGFRVYGYLIALIAAGSPYVIAALLAGWVFVAGYSRSSKTWGGLGLIITISAPLIVFRGSGPLATTLGLQQLALYRIQATLIGQLVAMGISIVWPVRAAVLLRNRSTARTLLGVRHSVAALIT